MAKNENEVVRAAIYLRSACDEAGSASLADQERSCREFAQQMSWQVTDVFSDAGRSGIKRSDRPGFKALLDAALCESRRFDYVLTGDPARIGRSVQSIVDFQTVLASKGIGIHFVEQSLDSKDPNFKLLMSVYQDPYSDMVDVLRERVKRDQIARVRHPLTGKVT